MWVEKHGPTYRIRDEATGQKVTLKGGYPNKTVAKKAMIEMRADQLRGDALVPRGGLITLNAWLDIWWPAHEVSLKPSTRHSEGARIRNHIRPLLGRVSLDDLAVDYMIVQRWLGALTGGEPDPAEAGKWRRRPLAPKTVANCHGLLYRAFQAAVTAKLIRANPCLSTALPERVHHEMRHLTDPEIARLVVAMPAHWRPLIVLLVSTGLRWGEAVGLRAGRVDLLARKPHLRIVETLQEMPSTGELVFGSPKTPQSRRTVTVTRRVADMLAPLVAGKARQDLVFLTPTGVAIRTRNFRRVWLAATARAGLAGTRIHDLRHTHAAMLISVNQSLTAIQRRLGHASISVTSDLYGHLRTEADDAMLAVIDDALAGVEFGDEEDDLPHGPPMMIEAPSEEGA